MFFELLFLEKLLTKKQENHFQEQLLLLIKHTMEVKLILTANILFLLNQMTL